MAPHYIKCCGDVWLDFTATTSCVGLQGEFPTRNRLLHYSEYHVQLICGNIFVIWFRSSQTKDLEGLSQISFPTTPFMFHILQPIFYQFCVYRRRYYLLYFLFFTFVRMGVQILQPPLTMCMEISLCLPMNLQCVFMFLLFM